MWQEVQDDGFKSCGCGGVVFNVFSTVHDVQQGLGHVCRTFWKHFPLCHQRAISEKTIAEPATLVSHNMCHKSADVINLATCILQPQPGKTRVGPGPSNSLLVQQVTKSACWCQLDCRQR